MIEKILERLASAIEDNTAALREQGAAVTNLMDAQQPAKKAPAKKKAAKKEPVKDAEPKIVDLPPVDQTDAEPTTTASMEGSEKKTEEPAEASFVNADPAKVQTHLRAIASQLTDTSKLFDLIKKHGGMQFSDLEPECYDALIAEAEALVEAGE